MFRAGGTLLIVYHTEFLAESHIPYIVYGEESFGNVDRATNTRFLGFLSRTQSRIVIAEYSGVKVGYYVYMPAERWLGINLTYAENLAEIRAKGYVLSKGCMPAYAHLMPPHNTMENFLAMNKVRIDDAVKQGYTYGIVGLGRNRIPGAEEEACYEAAWIDVFDKFAEFTGTTYEQLDVPRLSDKVYIQHYV